MIKKLAIYTAIALFVAGPVFASEKTDKAAEEFRKKGIELLTAIDVKNHDLFNEFVSSMQKAVKCSYEEVEKQTVENLLDKLVAEGVLEEWETEEYRELSE